LPDLRGSDASTLRTSDWEIPNCRSLLRATQWHAANYAATDKMQQVGQTTKLQKIRWLRIYAASQCPAIIALITTDAKRALVVDIRDRMPVILATRDYARWLGDEPTQVT
jgi:hypothetical protein